MVFTIMAVISAGLCGASVVAAFSAEKLGMRDPSPRTLRWNAVVSGLTAALLVCMAATP